MTLLSERRRRRRLRCVRARVLVLLWARVRLAPLANRTAACVGRQSGSSFAHPTDARLVCKRVRRAQRPCKGSRAPTCVGRAPTSWAVWGANSLRARRSNGRPKSVERSAGKLSSPPPPLPLNLGRVSARGAQQPRKRLGALRWFEAAQRNANYATQTDDHPSTPPATLAVTGEGPSGGCELRARARRVIN